MFVLTLTQVLVIHERVMTESGGQGGVRDLGVLQSAIAQPYMTFDNQELYPTLASKAPDLMTISIQIIQPITRGRASNTARLQTAAQLSQTQVPFPAPLLKPREAILKLCSHNPNHTVHTTQHSRGLGSLLRSQTPHIQESQEADEAGLL